MKELFINNVQVIQLFYSEAASFKILPLRLRQTETFLKNIVDWLILIWFVEFIVV